MVNRKPNGHPLTAPIIMTTKLTSIVALFSATFLCFVTFEVRADDSFAKMLTAIRGSERVELSIWTIVDQKPANKTASTGDVRAISSVIDFLVARKFSFEQKNPDMALGTAETIGIKCIGPRGVVTIKFALLGDSILFVNHEDVYEQRIKGRLCRDFLDQVIDANASKWTQKWQPLTKPLGK